MNLRGVEEEEEEEEEGRKRRARTRKERKRRGAATRSMREIVLMSLKKRKHEISNFERVCGH